MNYTPKIDPNYVMNLSTTPVVRPGPHGDGKEVVIAFAVPVYREVEFATYASHVILAAQWPFMAPSNWKLKFMPVTGSPVEVVRNKLVRRAAVGMATRAQNGDIVFGFEHLSNGPAHIIVGCDADCSFGEPEDYLNLIAMLLASPPDVAMIGVPLPCRAGAGELRANIRLIPGKEREPWMTPGALWEVESVGTGIFALRMDAIHMGVGEAPAGKVAYPWFEFKRNAMDDQKLVSWEEICSGNEITGEDYLFCQKLRAAGRRVMISAMSAGHIFANMHSVHEVAMNQRGRQLLDEDMQRRAQGQFGGGFSNG